MIFSRWITSFITPTVFLVIITALTPTTQAMDAVDTLWIEPARFGSYFRQGTPNQADVQLYVKKLKESGINKIVISYSAFLNGFLYQHTGSTPLSYLYYTKDTVGNLQIDWISSENSWNQSPTINGNYIVDELVDAAYNNGVQVIMGLSSAGDKNLLFDYQIFVANYGAPPAGAMYVDHNIVSIYDRIYSNNMFNMMLASALHAKYGNKVQGWYLTQEAHCFDQAMVYHWGVIAPYLKTITPNHKVWVSPVPSAEVCQPAVHGDYASILTAYTTPGGANAVSGKAAVDVVMYQDAVGAAFLLDFNGNSLYWYNLNYLGISARQEKINRNITVGMGLRRLRDLHIAAGSASSFYVNLEAWEMNGNCSSGVAGGGILSYLYYGCPYGGDFTGRVKGQIENYQSILGVQGKIMLNEGGLLFDFSNHLGTGEAFSSGFPLKNSPEGLNLQNKAIGFTDQFWLTNPR